MGKKAEKASRKYAASGKLKSEIQARKKHQQIKRSVERRKSGKSKRKGVDAKEREYLEDGQASKKNVKKASVGDTDAVGSGEEASDAETSRFNGMSVDDFLKGDFMQGSSSDGESNAASEDEEDAEDMDADEDDQFSDIDDLEDDEAATHKVELAKLAEQDPEFYKYLQENDEELLDFDVEGEEVDDEDVDMDGEEDGDEEEDVKAPALTKEILRGWQKGILQHRSLRSLRRLLVAFRSAVHMNDEKEVVVWRTDSPTVYEKLVTTSLRYTSVVLNHHVPYKKLPDGRYKSPAQTPKLKALQKLILSFLTNIMHLIETLTVSETLILALNESEKLIPYVTSSRKTIKAYLKMLLKLWSSAEDDVRIAAFLAVRTLMASGDEAIKDQILKNTYLTLLRNAKSTTVHTLPSINLMKNSASELFCADHATAYQHAFGYVRQLAVHLRNSMKVKTKDAFKQVYNWQYAHSIDFWSLVLARSCGAEAEVALGAESELRALIYPLTQVALGSIKLITSSRSFPFHLTVLRSLVHLARHTRTYIPLVPYLLPIITSTLSPSAKPKTSTLKPLDLETQIRAPAAYVRTRVYNTVVLEEATFILAEWAAAPHVQGSVAFPELVVPLLASLRKSLKKAAGGKEAGVVRGLVERIEEGAIWIGERRKGVEFGPREVAQVRAWERQADLEDAPIEKYVRMQRKVRENRRKLMEKARTGEDEILEN